MENIKWALSVNYMQQTPSKRYCFLKRVLWGMIMIIFNVDWDPGRHDHTLYRTCFVLR